MLVVTLLLLMVGVGFLVVALVIGPIALAWGAIAASAAAALTLALRWWRQRRADRKRRSGEAARRGTTGRPEPRAVGRPGRQRGEPAEEDTDAADLLMVCELGDEVLVIDERPRYHLDGCGWLAAQPATRSTQSLPVSEARDLGFTPCARCGPDAELARRHRTASAG